MDLSEKVLYHQIHPAKLAADITGSIISTYLMWHRRFGPAMLGAWVPAMLRVGGRKPFEQVVRCERNEEMFKNPSCT